MPTYEYFCRVCDHQFESEQKITDEPLVECPKCLTASLRRVIPSRTGFILKGGGWAKDLYSKQSKKES